MRFEFIDRVVERGADRVLAVRCISAGEEYLADHFPTYPVLPGVLMIEAMVQAARAMLPDHPHRLVLGRVRALKFGQFVRPGDVLTLDVRLVGREGDHLDFKGSASIVGQSDRTAAAGRFTLRPVRLGSTAAAC